MSLVMVRDGGECALLAFTAGFRGNITTRRQRREIFTDLFIRRWFCVRGWRYWLAQQACCPWCFLRVSQLVETLRSGYFARLEAQLQSWSLALKPCLSLLLLGYLDELSARSHWGIRSFLHLLEARLHLVAHRAQRLHVLRVVHLEPDSFLGPTAQIWSGLRGCGNLLVISRFRANLIASIRSRYYKGIADVVDVSSTGGSTLSGKVRWCVYRGRRYSVHAAVEDARGGHFPHVCCHSSVWSAPYSGARAALLLTHGEIFGVTGAELRILAWTR